MAWFTINVLKVLRTNLIVWYFHISIMVFLMLTPLKDQLIESILFYSRQCKQRIHRALCLCLSLSLSLYRCECKNYFVYFKRLLQNYLELALCNSPQNPWFFGTSNYSFKKKKKKQTACIALAKNETNEN